MNDSACRKRTDPVHIGGLQFLHFAVFEDQTGDLVFFGKFFKHFSACGIAAADIFFDPARTVTEFFKQDLRELERRVEVEGRDARQFEYLFGERVHFTLETVGKDGKFAHVHPHARALHIEKDIGKGEFQFPVKFLFHLTFAFGRFPVSEEERKGAVFCGKGEVLGKFFGARRSEIGIGEIAQKGDVLRIA